MYVSNDGTCNSFTAIFRSLCTTCTNRYTKYNKFVVAIFLSTLLHTFYLSCLKLLGIRTAHKTCKHEQPKSLIITHREKTVAAEARLEPITRSVLCCCINNCCSKKRFTMMKEKMACKIDREKDRQTQSDGDRWTERRRFNKLYKQVKEYYNKIN